METPIKSPIGAVRCMIDGDLEINTPFGGDSKKWNLSCTAWRTFRKTNALILSGIIAGNRVGRRVGNPFAPNCCAF
jgi:hypothetical protein